MYKELRWSHDHTVREEGALKHTYAWGENGVYYTVLIQKEVRVGQTSAQGAVQQWTDRVGE